MRGKPFPPPPPPAQPAAVPRNTMRRKRPLPGRKHTCRLMSTGVLVWLRCTPSTTPPLRSPAPSMRKRRCLFRTRSLSD